LPPFRLNVSRCLLHSEENEAGTAREYCLSAKLASKGKNNEIASIEIPSERQWVECRRIYGPFGLIAILGG
jgi:hypothetical protein